MKIEKKGMLLLFMVQLTGSEYIGPSKKNAPYKTTAPYICEGYNEEDIANFEQKTCFVKLRANNPFRLCCEILGYRICKQLLLPVPDIFLFYITDDFADELSDDRVKQIFNENVGVNFATEQILSVGDSTHDGKELEDNIEDAMVLLLLDLLVRNGDRVTTNVNCLRADKRFYPIDNEMCFTALNSTDIPTGFTTHLLQNHLTYETVKKALLSKNKESIIESVTGRFQNIDNNFINSMFTNIPEAWYTGNGHQDKKEIIETYLYDFTQNSEQTIQDMVKEIVV